MKKIKSRLKFQEERKVQEHGLEAGNKEMSRKRILRHILGLSAVGF